jgi:hypothetical protein
MPEIRPAAADRNEDRVDRARMLPQDFHADRALPGDHFRIVERMHVGERAAALELQSLLVGLGVGIAVQHDLGAARRDRVHLDARRGDRHHDHRLAAQALRRERHALRMVPRARRDHAAAQARLRQPGHLVVGAAQLEREYRLQVLALDQHAVAEALGKPRRRIERRLDRHVVDARLQDPLEIIVFQGR